MESISPAQHAALRYWVLMGGTLVVTGVPGVDELGWALRMNLLQDPEAEQALQFSAGVRFDQAMRRIGTYEEFTKKSAMELQNPGISSVGAQELSAIRTFPEIPNDLTLGTAKEIAEMREWITSRKESASMSKAIWSDAVRSEVGVGTVIAVKSVDFDVHASAPVLSDVVEYRRSPLLGRGVDPVMGDGRSKAWLIPGVAEPPVYTFIGILTLFVMLVGPIAYRWTTRGHRSHLMFLIAPALALVTTASMFAYSILSDGFGTSVRVRQLTWIDGASGDGVERIRATLFSGISPREGIGFDSGAEVMIYPDGGVTAWHELDTRVNEVRLNATVSDTEQRFGSSALPSRTQTQFVSHRTREGLGALSLSGLPPRPASPEEGGSPSESMPDPPHESLPDSVQVSSTLPFSLVELVIRSPDGAYWHAESIDAGQSVQARRIVKDAEASVRLGELYTRYRPIDKVSRSARDRSSRNPSIIRDLTVYINRGIRVNGEALTDGTFERQLNATLLIKGDLFPGTFVAITEPSADAIPVASAEQIESIRYVMGTLR